MLHFGHGLNRPPPRVSCTSVMESAGECDFLPHFLKIPPHFCTISRHFLGRLPPVWSIFSAQLLCTVQKIANFAPDYRGIGCARAPLSVQTRRLRHRGCTAYAHGIQKSKRGMRHQKAMPPMCHPKIQEEEADRRMKRMTGCGSPRGQHSTVHEFTNRRTETHGWHRH